MDIEEKDFPQMELRKLEEHFNKLGGHSIKHLLLCHPDYEMIIETCKSVACDYSVIPHTPYAHKDHKDGEECNCCEVLHEADFVCKCGASYDKGVYDFVSFYCYDCNKKLSKNYL